MTVKNEADQAKSRKNALGYTTALFGAVAAAAAFAPSASFAQEAATSTATSEETIVVTGSLIRGNTNSVSPLTIVDDEELEKRGVNTTQDAIQTLTANNGPALTNSFSANGAFAGGASAVSLRGLTVNSTLVLFDGLRASYYPLADDGTRNFVDLNTIPDDIVDHIEVLRDGASSQYGADAIAGVVNIITKKEFQGVGVRVEGGVSDRSDAGQHRFSLTAGHGDLDDDGFNAYFSVFRYHSDLLKNSERPYPYNSDDLSDVCFEGNCGANGIINGIQDDGSFALSTAANFLVRPYTVTDPNLNTIAAVAGGRWENLGACTGGASLVPLTVAQQGATNPAEVCQYDYANRYFVINPEIDRWGISGRFTTKLWDNAEAYVEGNFLETSVGYNGNPAVFVGTANTGVFYPRFSTSTAVNPTLATGSYQLFLPVYVCPERVNCDTSPNGVLNPNNPYAAQGQVARLIGRNHDETTQTETINRSYRIAGGVTGAFSNGWDYNFGATMMHTDLQRRWENYVWIDHLLDVVADGSYNFVNPSLNSQAVHDYVQPSARRDASSDQVEFNASVVMPVFDLPGGTAQLAVGTSIRYEAVDAPSGNTDFFGPTERFFTLNAFGTSGNRTVYSGFFELDAPVTDRLDVNLSGRVDDYSSGQSSFSPKIGARYQPIDMLTLRASYSEGFRIPSFAEANALPTTGFVTNNVSLFNDTYLAQYGCTTANFSACPTYIRSGSYGQTTLASPNLDPEESTSTTLGFIFEPFKSLTIAVDYYEIEKTGAITQPSNAPALLAYYAGQAIPAGYTVIADAPDVNFPAATPRVAFVQSQLVNANTNRVEGWDFSVTFEHDITSELNYETSLDVSYIQKLETEFPDGTVERYDGTLGNFNLTSGNGTPKTRATWVNTLAFGMFSVSGTMNFFEGYDLSAQDQGTGYKDCGLSDGTTPCEVDDYLTVDLTGQAEINDNFTVYLNVLNVGDELPPVDVITYGATHYNAVQGGNGILGRYYRAGVRMKF